MDVGELLSYQPEKPGFSHKRQRHYEGENDNESDYPKKSKLSENDLMKAESQLSEETRVKIAQIVEDEEPEIDVLDEIALKRMLLQFEKRVYKNQEMRVKFPDMPEKFMESEMELNDVLHEMHVVATVPALYHVLVELNTVQSLLQLLTHDNTDISIAVVDLIQELTDVDTLNESEDGATALVDALLDGQIVALLVQNLERLDETVKEEADGVHNTLGIMENLTEFRPEICPDSSQQGLMQWILKRLKAKIPFDANKLYACEIMSILLQNHDENRQYIGELDGIDVLLQQLASYKRHDPVNRDEIELMENLFNCLCSALMLPCNRAKFLKGEGLQLMNLMLREKRMSRNSAIKVLNHSMTGSEGADNCQKFIDILGLRTIFPLFMKTPKQSKAGPIMEELEEHITSIICNLLRNCQGTQRQRLLNKFTENDHEKVERLLELHFKYLEKVHRVDDQIEKEKHRIMEMNEELDEDHEDQFYLRRLEAGLFTLQLIDCIMLEICASGASSVKQRVMQILNMRGGSLKTIRNIMREYAGNIGTAKDAESKEAEQSRILQLVDKF
ncbi:beta-catenin-like protein 1 isoform X1 [Octopus bimaculoides]|uniref:Beta-catenin-like protein 1 n=2 Tax=Octopus bimaculoides TaxID=37653 RepID=A0A0L8FZN0_OCTBM|nr:beta-catenin-like protein 1 isoform X1 [Octopus bimaculoides]|eukprot:XP_014785410.1 PREDICTED: beta-catenin-like protein 1 [Octopus bimaculoides]